VSRYRQTLVPPPIYLTVLTWFLTAVGYDGVASPSRGRSSSAQTLSGPISLPAEAARLPHGRREKEERKPAARGVPGVTKCQRVQTLFVICVTVTLVTSWWARVFLYRPPSVIPSSQQLDAIFPAFPYVPYPTRRPGLRLPPKPCLYSPRIREEVFSETPMRPCGCLLVRSYVLVASTR
jgi:hypothetical protein